MNMDNQKNNNKPSVQECTRVRGVKASMKLNNPRARMARGCFLGKSYLLADSEVRTKFGRYVCFKNVKGLQSSKSYLLAEN